MSIFPITQEEADLLHNLGWNSGYAWESNFDWWFKNDPCETSERTKTQMMLMEHIVTIREFRRRASLAAIEHIKFNQIEIQY